MIQQKKASVGSISLGLNLKFIILGQILGLISGLILATPLQAQMDTEEAPVEAPAVSETVPALDPVEPAAPEYIEPAATAPIPPAAEVEPTIDAEPSYAEEPPAIAPPAATATEPAYDESNAYIDTQEYSIGAAQPQPYSQSSEPIAERFSGGSPPARTVYLNATAIATAPETFNAPSVSNPTFSGSLGALPPLASTNLGGSDRLTMGNDNLGRRTYKLTSLYRRLNALQWLLPSGLSMIFPLAIPAPISSAFGWRTNPVSGLWRMHSGTDLAAPMGTPVLAAAAGKVAMAEFFGGYGLSILLNHQSGQRETRYAHLAEIFVKPGQWVQQGAVIGLVGSTGNSTGPHLHFEILEAKPEGMVAVDPGPQLEIALTQLVKALQTAQTKPNKGA